MSSSPPLADSSIDGAASGLTSESSRPMFLASAGSDDPSTLSAPAQENTSRQAVLILGVLLTIAIGGWAGYRLFRGSGGGSRMAAVSSTEQQLESPQRASSGGESSPRPEQPASASQNANAHGQVWSLILEATIKTTDAENALGTPDGRLAEIQPGGSLALARPEGPFYNGDGPDIRVDGPAGHRVPYTIFARTGPQDAWEHFDVNRKGFAAGTASHDFGHHGIKQAQQIMIRNEGTAPLYIDAITPLYLQPDAHDHDDAAGH